MNLVNRIVIVCLGNICRSPAAFGFFEAVIEQHELSCFLDSAGINALIGSRADQNVCDIMNEKYGIDLAFHSAKQLTDQMMFENDLILVMDLEQEQYLQKQYHFAAGKIYRLGKWRGINIKDPYHESRKFFLENIALIKDCVSDWTQKLWEVG